MPSNHLILCHPLLLPPSIFPSIRVFSSESVLCIRWPKYWSLSFSISPSNEYSGLSSFRMDLLALLAVQGTLKSLLQHHSSKSSIFRCSVFFIVQLSHPYMTTRKMKQLCNSYLLRILPFKTLVCARMLSCVWLGATPWTGAPQAPLSMGFSSQEDWSGSPLPFHTVPWKDWCCSWSSSTLATWCKELTHLKIPWCWERLKADGEGDVRGWDGWMASPTWWIWVWTNSRSWWWTGKPGMLLQSMGSQRVRHDWVTEFNWG